MKKDNGFTDDDGATIAENFEVNISKNFTKLMNFIDELQPYIFIFYF